MLDVGDSGTRKRPAPTGSSDLTSTVHGSTSRAKHFRLPNSSRSPLRVTSFVSGGLVPDAGNEGAMARIKLRKLAGQWVIPGGDHVNVDEAVCLEKLLKSAVGKDPNVLPARV